MKHYMPEYTIKKLYHDTYAIVDATFGLNSANLYLLVGKEQALLIDSGFGCLGLRDIISKITDKPVICSCTHGHIDHALGAWQFEKSYLHSADFDLYKEHTSKAVASAFFYHGKLPLSSCFLKNPFYSGLVKCVIQRHYPTLCILEDMPCFDLGGRTVNWTSVPGHTRGSVAFLDEQAKVVFDGDCASFGAWLFLPEALPLKDFLPCARTYADFLQKNNVKLRYGGHMSKPIGIKQLENLIRCGEFCLENPKAGFKYSLLNHDVRIVLRKGSSVFLPY